MNASPKLAIEDSGVNTRIEVQSTDFRGIIRVNGSNNSIKIAKINRCGPLDISITGDNCHVDIGAMRRLGNLRAVLKSGGTISIKEKSTIESAYILADAAQVAIGRDCMISFNVTLRTTDAHGIYDLESGELQNPPAGIVLNDHVWLGQDSTVLKGAGIGKNSVVAAGSIVSRGLHPAHAIMAGTPARVIREGIVWDRRMTENIYADGANIDPFLHEHLK